MSFLSVSNKTKARIVNDNLVSAFEKAIEVVIKDKIYKGDLKVKNDFGISLAFVDDEEIRKINKEYRGKDKATDVLSFGLTDRDGFVMPGDRKVNGEILISIEAAKQQALKYKVTLEEELLRLYVHGLLHITGFDHEKENEREEMILNETKILNEINDFESN